MDIGVTLTIRNCADDPEPLTEIYRRNIGDVLYAEQLGFDFVWVSEHHFAPDAWSPSPLHILGAIAARTSRIELGTNLLLVPFTTRCAWRKTSQP